MLKEVKDYTEITNKNNIWGYINNGNIDIPFYSKRRPEINLGIYKTVNGKIRTDRYCGYTWLKGKNGQIIKDNGENVVLHIEPRFDLNLNKMFETISTDDEFFEYLGIETEEPLIRFFHEEEMIDANKKESTSESLIAVISFICLLEKRTRTLVIRRMTKVEENATGKIHGHILMNKQISKNLAQGHKERIYAVHNERTVDTVENRILLYVLKCAENYLNGTANSDEGILHNIALIKNRLREVKLSDTVRYRCEDIDKAIQKLPNIYRNYIPVFNFAKIILLKGSVEVNSKITAKIIPYAINSHMLYECYVRTRIKQVIQSLSTDECKIEMLKYVKDKKNIPNEEEYGARSVIRGKDAGCYIAGNVIPDIVIRYTLKNEVFYRVYDVKYKEDKQYRGRGDRLQLLAYNLLYQVHNNTGFIMAEAQNGYRALNINTDEKIYGVISVVNTEEKSEEWLTQLIAF